MSLKERLAHSAAVAKWRTDQQVRLLKSQNSMRAIENKVDPAKVELADRVIQLLSQGETLHEELMPLFETIVELDKQIGEEKDIQERIKSEVPPQLAAVPVGQQFDMDSQDYLVCPECNKPMAGKYCPEHGVEGISLVSEPIDEPVSEAVVDDGPPLMICPKCKKPMSVRFCPEHGLEGIPG